MLNFARQNKPVKTKVNVHELIDNTLEIRSYVLKTANIEIVRDYDPALPWITADPGQLQQVFLNLIVNAEFAMKKAHDKGKLIIKTDYNDKSVRLSFRDDGPGISEEVKQKLFQPFFTTKDSGEGTGLGLSLSRAIIREHGGTISIESHPGQGAEFIITLPVTPLEEPTAETTPDDSLKSSAAFKAARILVVDDEETIRLLIQKILSPLGCCVDSANNSTEALSGLDNAVYDAMLLDIRMPGISGMEFHAKISETHPEYLRKMVFMTGDISGMDVKSFLKQNDLPCIQKPFGRKELLQALSNIIK